MKKFILFLLVIASAIGASAQVPGACGKNKNPIPMDGSGSLGQAYNNSGCGLNYVQASKLVETRFDPYTNAGNLGCGLPCSWSISGLPAGCVIDKAFVWALVSYQSATAPTATVTITNPATNTNSYSGSSIGTASSICWGETGTAVYRWDVTTSISGNGTYTFNFSGFSNPVWEIDGATLFIIYKDPSVTYQGSLVISDGAIAQAGPASTATMTGFNVCANSSSAKAFTISGDHQDNIAATHSTTLNAVASNFPNNFYSFDEAPVTLTSAQTTSAFGMDGSGGSDCYLWGVMGLYYQTTNCAVCTQCVSTVVNIDSIINTSSCNLNNGAIYISDSTSAGPLTYSWSNGATTQNITGISAGTYSVAITDTTGCSTYLYATVLSPSNLTVTVDSISTVPCYANNGSINVFVLGGTPPYTYSWSTGATTQDVTGLPYGNYTLTVTDSSGCSAMAFASDETGTNPITPAICMVTVDSLSQYNVIMWDKTSYLHVDSFIVYRETTTNNYQPIGAVPFNALSLFVDTVRTKYFPNTGNPNGGTYRYKLQILDSCGNHSALSSYHNTIFMTNNNGNFSWPQLYTIENSTNPVGAYVLMRDDSSNGNWHAVNSVAGTQQSVSDPSYSAWQSTANWRVQTSWNITCTPSRINPNALASFNASKSNTTKTVAASVNEISLNNSISIYPNPTTGMFNVQCSMFNVGQMEVLDVVGRKIISQNFEHGTLNLDLTDQPSGIYFLNVKTSSGIAVKKIIKE